MNRFILFIASAALFSTTAAFADKAGADWMPKEKVVQKLAAHGLTGVSGMDADDGHWEGDAIRNGKIVEFHADAHTGKLINVKPKHKD